MISNIPCIFSSSDIVIQQYSPREKAFATSITKWNENESYFSINTVKKIGDSRKLENCKSWNNFLIEFDEIPVSEQEIILNRNRDKVSMATFSGNKSIHMIVHLSNPPTSKEEYGFVHSYLIEKYFRGADVQCKDALRLSRTPNAIRENGRRQVMILNELQDLYFPWETAYEVHLATKKAQEFSFQFRGRKSTEGLSVEAEAILRGDFPKHCRDEYIRKGIPMLFYRGYSYNQATANLNQSHNLTSIRNYWEKLEMSNPK